MPVGKELQLRLHLVADILAKRTARMKAATRRRMDRARHVSLKDHPFFLAIRIGNRNGGEKSAGIRMLRVLVNLVAGGDLHDLSQIHDRHPVADMLDHSEIVGNKKIGEMPFFLKLLQEIDDLGLNRDIQGGDRLVRHDKFWIHSQGPVPGVT